MIPTTFRKFMAIFASFAFIAATLVTPVAHANVQPNTIPPSGSAVWVTQGDELTYDCTSAIFGTNHEQASITWRIQRASDGQIVEANFTTGANACGANGPYWSNIPITTEGWLVYVNLENPNGDATGCNYTQVFLRRQTTLFPANNGMMLIGAAIPAFYSVSWPTQPTQTSDGGQACIQDFNPSNPSAGANLSYTTQNGATTSPLRYQPMSMYFTFVASATVATRQVIVVFTNSAGVKMLTATSPCTQAAGTTINYELEPGTGSNYTVATTLAACTAGADVIIPMPGRWQFNDKTVITTSITNIQATDQISGVLLHMATWNNTD